MWFDTNKVKEINDEVELFRATITKHSIDIDEMKKKIAILENSAKIGYTGSKGDVGYTGSKGDAGTGYTGSKGEVGVGYTGSKGVIGITGYTGSKGDIGYTGSIGSSSISAYDVESFDVYPVTTSNIYATWKNPLQFGFDSVYLFRYTSTLLDKDFDWCFFNATLIYNGKNESCTDTGITSTIVYYYKIFTKFSSIYSTGIDKATEKTVFVDNYWISGDTNWNNAINKAHTALAAIGGGTLVFANKDYKIQPAQDSDTITLIDNLKWRGVTGARLYSGMSNNYNYWIIGRSKSNITFENIIFDQRNDSFLCVQKTPFRSGLIVYFYACNNVDIHDCTAYVWGSVSFLCDAYEANYEACSLFKCTNNKIYWKRPVYSPGAGKISFSTDTTGDYITSTGADFTGVHVGAMFSLAGCTSIPANNKNCTITALPSAKVLKVAKGTFTAGAEAGSVLIDQWYDVSVFHIQSKTIHFNNNYIENITSDLQAQYIPETGVELHHANGTVLYNTIKKCANPTLWVPWPSTWTYYDPNNNKIYPDSTGNPNVFAIDYGYNTFIQTAKAGFSLWYGLKGANRNVKDIRIHHNMFGIHLDYKGKYGNYEYVAVLGIQSIAGGSYATIADNIEIDNNQFNYTYNTAKYANLTAVKNALYWLTAHQFTGLFNFDIGFSASNINIHHNTVSQYPFSLLNLWRTNNSSGAYRHTNIICSNNTAINCCYATPYQDYCKHAINLGSVNGVTIQNNVFSNPDIAMLGQKNEIEYVSNLIYNNNTF